MNPQQPGGQLPPNQPQPAAPPNPTYTPVPGPIPGPQQQYGTPQPSHAPEYEFIMNPGQTAKKPLIGGGSMLGRVMLALGVLIVLVIIAVVISSLLKAKSANLQPLITVAQDQTELIRVAALGNSQAVGQSVRNSAINTSLSLKSANQQLLTYLANNHQKVGTKVLSLKRDARTDTQLNTADSASNFDPVFVGILQAQLTAYQHDLKAAYDAKPGPTGEKLLKDDYTAAELLLAQTKQ